jgi:hypothetical protein
MVPRGEEPSGLLKQNFEFQYSRYLGTNDKNLQSNFSGAMWFFSQRRIVLGLSGIHQKK